MCLQLWEPLVDACLNKPVVSDPAVRASGLIRRSQVLLQLLYCVTFLKRPCEMNGMLRYTDVYVNWHDGTSHLKVRSMF